MGRVGGSHNVRSMSRRPRVQATAFVAAGALAPGLALLGPPADGDALEPDVEAVLRLIERFRWPALERLSVPAARREAEREARVLAGLRPRRLTVRDVTLSGAGGPLGGRLYVPARAAPGGPLLLYFHGGGWLFGSPGTLDTVCRFLAWHAGIRVLSSSYRLAPEAPFPAAAEDAIAALEWVRGHAGGLGSDPRRIAIGGDSAGAGLATVAAREGGDAAAVQLLLCPITDLSREHPSYAEFAHGPVLGASQMRWFREHYLTHEEDACDPSASPLLAAELAHSPAAYVAVAGFDPLRDEGLAYADRLRAAGVTLALAYHPRLPHAFVEFAGVSRSSRAALVDAGRWLRAALHTRL